MDRKQDIDRRLLLRRNKRRLLNEFHQHQLSGCHVTDEFASTGHSMPLREDGVGGDALLLVGAVVRKLRRRHVIGNRHGDAGRPASVEVDKRHVAHTFRVMEERHEGRLFPGLHSQHIPVAGEPTNAASLQ